MKIKGIFDRSYITRFMLYVFMAALGFGLIVYVSYHLLDRFSPGIELIDAVPTTVSKTESVYAYIMRDGEEIYASDVYSGSIAPAVHDGAHVSAYSKLVDVYSASSPDTESRLNELDEQIALLEKNKSDDRSVQSTSGIDSDIFSDLFLIRSHCEDGDYKDALALRTNLLVSIKKRAILTGEITDYSSHIAMLENEKSSLKSGLGSLLKTVYSPRAGYYYSASDGYESIFSSDKIDSITFDDFVGMTEASPEHGAGVCIGTLVGDYKWYIACIMSKSAAAGLSDSNTCDVLFSYSGDRLSMKVYRIIPETPGERAVVILQCGKLPVNFDYTRVQPVEIVTAEYTGYEIPRSAVRVVGGFEGVYIKDEVTVAFRRIHIIYESDGMVICTGKPDSMKYETNPDGTFVRDENGQRIEIVDVNDEIYPWIGRNDIIVAGGTELFSGRVLDE